MRQFPSIPSSSIVSIGVGLTLLRGIVAGAALATPAAEVNSLRHGTELFATRGCTHCHGQAGEGTDRGPALRGLRNRLSSRQISEQIKNGSQAMPAFGSVLDDTAIQDLVFFLRSPSGLGETDPASPAP